MSIGPVESSYGVQLSTKHFIEAPQQPEGLETFFEVLALKCHN
jgi:hypothetical protein